MLHSHSKNGEKINLVQAINDSKALFTDARCKQHFAFIFNVEAHARP